MDLVNEYLRAVAALLPKTQRQDIIDELRDTILTRIEAREGELGRPLTDDEAEAVLREVGHPLVIAARYGDGPQHLVGPTLYPYWLFAVKAAIALQVAVAVVVVIVRTLAFGNFSAVLGQAIGSGVTGALVMIGAATVAAWFVERQGARIDYLDQWRVRDLRLLEIATWDFSTLREWFAGEQARRRPERAQPRAPEAWPQATPVARGLGLIVVGTALILWWTGILSLGPGVDADDLRRLGIAPGRLETVSWSAFKAIVFWPVLLYSAAFVLQGAVLLARPGARRLQGALEAGKGALLLGFCAWLNTASPLAPSLGVGSLSDFIQRMATLAHSPPTPLEPIVILVVLSVAFSGLVLLTRGLWTLATVGPGREPTPAPGLSNSAT